MTDGPTSQRLNYFDYLRVIAVFMGLCLHTAMPFTTADFYYWYIKVNNSSIIVDNILMLVHIYYMPLFMLIAGYFACQIYQKYGWKECLHNRATRIGLPYLIIMLILIPVHTQDVFYYIYNQQFSTGAAIPYGPGFASWMSSQITTLYHSGEIWRFYNSNNAYWFLYYLIWYYIVILFLELVLNVLNRVLSIKIKQWFNFIFTTIYLNPLVIAIILFGLLSNSQTWYLDISYKFLPPLHIMFFYGLFFLVGWFFKRQNSIATCTQHCGIYFLMAAGIFLPIFFVLRKYGLDYGNPHYAIYKMICLLFYSLISSFLVFSSIGLSMRYLNKYNVVIRYISNASYWMYLGQVPIILLAQVIIIHLPWSPIIQFFCVLLSSLIILLVLYQYLVRHTWVGQLLNGTRHLNEV